MDIITTIISNIRELFRRRPRVYCKDCLWCTTYGSGAFETAICHNPANTYERDYWYERGTGHRYEPEKRNEHNNCSWYKLKQQ